MGRAAATEALRSGPRSQIQIFITPSRGAAKASQRPHGLTWQFPRSGLPNKVARGIKGVSFRCMDIFKRL